MLLSIAIKYHVTLNMEKNIENGKVEMSKKALFSFSLSQTSTQDVRVLNFTCFIWYTFRLFLFLFYFLLFLTKKNKIRSLFRNNMLTNENRKLSNWVNNIKGKPKWKHQNVFSHLTPTMYEWDLSHWLDNPSLWYILVSFRQPLNETR